MSWKEIAWNGIRLSVPAPWEAARIDPRYLVFADREKPVLEIKWGRIKGTFSHRTALRRLRAAHGSAVQESVLPEGWKKPLGDFVVTGFAWSGDTISARGAILYCPACGNAALIQFFRNHSDPADETAPRVLASFRDHRHDDRVIWSIFDIRAVTPAEFALVRHRFDVGRFELNFRSKRQKITLLRWGPASALLSNGPLLRFAAAETGMDESALHTLFWDGRQAVQSTLGAQSRGWLTAWDSLRGVPSFQWCRFWRLPEKNRIFAVRATGSRPVAAQLLDRICTDYESL